MRTEISLLSISSQSSTDAVGFWIFSAERENICSPMFATLRTICTNRILQITAGVAGSRSTQTPAFFADCSPSEADRATHMLQVKHRLK